MVALAASLVFFAWGQLYYIPLMFLVIIVNFFLAQQVEKERQQANNLYLILGVLLNLTLLLSYKVIYTYGSAWFGISSPVIIPLGLSYITFQVIAYLVDIHNEIHDSEKNFLNFALYILLFPKIVTGPIARYRDIGASLSERESSFTNTAHGARRFIQGLAKKALIADQLAKIVTPAFALATPGFSTNIAWIVLIAYALQLYFDFSGYIDMAIGMGQMLGFRFVENFNYPYIAKSISDFWRRWHISLSSWFRDYVFYPLEFAHRRNSSRVRQQFHILIVFFLTGLWHGVTINFIIWGLIHGAAVTLEMTGFGRWLKKTWPPIAHIYTLGVVLLGWVFFRSPTPAFAFELIARLAGSQQGVQVLPFDKTQPLPIIDNSIWIALILGILLSMPMLQILKAMWARVMDRLPFVKVPAQIIRDLALLILLVASVAATASANLVASIYGGF